MRVGISAHTLGTNTGGIETFVRGSIRGLGAVDPRGDYTLFLSPPLPTDPVEGSERMRRVVVPTRHTLLRNAVTFPLALAKERIDVVHVQYAAPPLCPSRIVVSVYDLIHEYHPDFYTRDVLLQYRALVPFTIRRAAIVHTVSEYSKRDIVRRYCVPPDKVAVTLCAADPLFRQIHDEQRLADVRLRYHTGDHFILYVGNIERRKNLKTLIEAYVRLRQTDATRHNLVLVGRNAWLYDDIFATARTSGYADELVFTGYVPKDDLIALYNAASLFVYPSLFEGFGIPPLEAMACGTPVVCSNASSLPEVVDDAAIMVDPLAVDELAAAIARTLRDDDLRRQLIARGLQRTAMFTWEKAAQRLVEIYDRAFQSR